MTKLQRPSALQDDLPVVKFEESVSIIPAESAELLESLEHFLHEIQSQDSAASSPIEPTVKEDEVDVASALFDSLIKGVLGHFAKHVPSVTSSI